MNHTTNPSKTEDKPIRIPPNPSGLCWCGCGGITQRAKRSHAKNSYVAGEYMRYIKGHTSQPKLRNRIPPNPSGLCECGCGRTTEIASGNETRSGNVAGEHKRYIHGHNGVLPISDEERFWNSVDKSGDCWLWTAGIGNNGYGTLSIKNKPTLTHRYSYELHNGPIPDGLYVLHNCPGGDNGACVNPAHLWLGTHLDNIADAVAKGRVRKGQEHGMAKLTEADVRQLRLDYANGMSAIALEEKYGIHRNYAVDVANRRAWKHIK